MFNTFLGYFIFKIYRVQTKHFIKNTKCKIIEFFVIRIEIGINILKNNFLRIV